MSDYYGDVGVVQVDWKSPAVLAARKEPLHETDGEAFDAELGPDDDGEFITLGDIEGIPRDALLKLVLWLIPSNSKPCKRWRIGQLRLAIVAHMLDADGIGRESFEVLGKQLGCTRALLSYHSLKMIDALSIQKLRGGKPRRTREVYRQSAIESHRRRGHRIKQDESQDAFAIE